METPVNKSGTIECASHDSIHTDKTRSAKQNSGWKAKQSELDQRVLKQNVLSKKRTTAAEVTAELSRFFSVNDYRWKAPL
ncbi:hypothetical protein TNCV_3381781 [Trichonephila clavipes]|nr:hypothetical protein TNCV_3381781 [Trichonephila clavipes]